MPIPIHYIVTNIWQIFWKFITVSTEWHSKSALNHHGFLTNKSTKSAIIQLLTLNDINKDLFYLNSDRFSGDLLFFTLEGVNIVSSGRMVIQFNISTQFVLFSMAGTQFMAFYILICYIDSGPMFWNRFSEKCFLVIYLHVLHVINVNSWHTPNTSLA